MERACGQLDSDISNTVNAIANYSPNKSTSTLGPSLDFPKSNFQPSASNRLYLIIATNRTYLLNTRVLPPALSWLLCTSSIKLTVAGNVHSCSLSVSTGYAPNKLTIYIAKITTGKLSLIDSCNNAGRLIACQWCQ